MHKILRHTDRQASHTARSVAGFTLIELLITIAIVAILATIAYSTYQDSIVRSRRAAGAACLQERAQFMERFYTTNLAYVTAAGVAAPIAQCDAEISPHYQIQYQVAPTAAAPRVYTLRAVPQAAQATRDTACGTLTINQAGVRGRTGTAPVTDCW